MWKQRRIKSGKEKGKEEDKNETTLAKVNDKAKEKAKGSGKAKDGKKIEEKDLNVKQLQSQGTHRRKCWKKDP